MSKPTPTPDDIVDAIKHGELPPVPTPADIAAWKAGYAPCVGCDGESVATGPDQWCDDCRNIAKVEGIAPIESCLHDRCIITADGHGSYCGNCGETLS